MFVFYGSLKNEIIKQSSVKQGLCYSLVMLPFIILGIIISIILGVFKIRAFVGILSLTLILILISIMLIFASPRSIVHRLPQRITFKMEENLITIEKEGLKDNYLNPKTKYITKIKKIIDYGDWYLIIFKGDITDSIICEKDLLIYGTINEFDQSFQNLIVIKNKK